MNEAELLAVALDWKRVAESGISFTMDAISSRGSHGSDASVTDESRASDTSCLSVNQTSTDDRIEEYRRVHGPRRETQGRKTDPPGDPPGNRNIFDTEEPRRAGIDWKLLRGRDSVSAPSLEFTEISDQTISDQTISDQTISDQTISDQTISDQTQNLGNKRSVQFKSVEVREHTYTLGSTASRKFGGITKPPLTELSWDAQSVTISTLDEYEAARGPRRPPSELHKSENERWHILKKAGFGSEELRAAAQPEIEDVRIGRERTTEQAASTLNVPLYQDFQQRFKVEESRHQNTKTPGNMLRGLFRRHAKPKSTRSLGQM